MAAAAAPAAAVVLSGRISAPASEDVGRPRQPRAVDEAGRRRAAWTR